jgi:hypothetical protein
MVPAGNVGPDSPGGTGDARMSAPEGGDAVNYLEMELVAHERRADQRRAAERHDRVAQAPPEPSRGHPVVAWVGHELVWLGRRLEAAGRPRTGVAGPAVCGGQVR